jgi:hypothetical protein
MTDHVNEVSRRIATLEQEAAELKRKPTRVFSVLNISTIKEPFLRLMISLDATEAQEAAIYESDGRGGSPVIAGPGGDGALRVLRPPQQDHPWP